MNIIHFIYKFRSYQLDLDLFKKNKGYFILNGVLAYADSFEDLMNEKIEVGVNVGAAVTPEYSTKNIDGLCVVFVDEKPVSCYFVKNNDKVNKNVLPQRKCELRKFCNGIADSTYKVEPFSKIYDIGNDQGYYFCKITDLKQKELNSKEHEDNLRSR